MLLAFGVLASVVVLAVRDRDASVVGGGVARVLGLGEKERARPAGLRVLVWREGKGSEGRWRAAAVLKEGERGTKGDEERSEREREEFGAGLKAAAGGALAAEYGLEAKPVVRSGWWAPTRGAFEAQLTRRRPAGASDVGVTPEVERAALDAVARAARPYAGWKPYRPVIDNPESAAGVEAAGPGEGGSGSVVARNVTRVLKDGYLHNAVVGALVVLLGMSLSRKPNDVIEAWDKGCGLVKQLGGTAVLGVVWSASPAVLGILLLANLGIVGDLLTENIVLGWVVYVGLFVVSAGVGFLPTYGQSVLGGWVFGFLFGFPGAMLGFVGGSVVGYAIARRVSRDKVTGVLESNEKARTIRDALIGHGTWRTFWIVTLIRVPPNSPFALTNLVLASAGVKLLPYVLGTALGMAPRTAIAVAFAAVGRMTGARDIQELIEDQPWYALPLGIAAFAVMLGIIGFVANRAIAGVTRRPGA